ncbi:MULTISPECIES: hypothetical protein [unclassified Mycoplasma]|uniref:hypothetical protein n=1 Tax=unclassified Mycoplasma TaxID=2683645 RepID=UPI002B25844E|nr:hypothetical protein [Mycoplasma sp. 1232]MEA4333937.1 hypothetical protein [Mycoplasma sp. 1232]
MLTFFETQTSSSSESSNAMDKLYDFFANLMSSKISDPTIWMPILIVTLVLFSFVTGWFLRWKWTIFKTVSIVITIIVSVILSVALKAAFEKKAQEDQKFQSAYEILTFAITFISLAVYWGVRGFLWLIIGIIHLATIKKRKEKNKKRSKLSRAGFGGLWAITNVILTLPGSLLLANVISTMAPNSNKANKATEIGVKIMTGGQGSSVTNLASGIFSMVQLFVDSELHDLAIKFIKEPNSLSKDDIEKLLKNSNTIAAILENEKFVDIVAKNIPTLLDEKSKNEIKNNKELEAYITKYEAQFIAANPGSTLNSSEQNKADFTKFVVDKINEELQQNSITLIPEEVKNVFGMLGLAAAKSDSSQEQNLSKIVDAILKINPTISEKTNTADLALGILGNLKNSVLKDLNKQETTETLGNTNNQPNTENPQPDPNMSTGASE